MRVTKRLIVDSPHWTDVENHKDHELAIDYFNRYKLTDNALICWQASMYDLGIVYLARVPGKEEEAEIPEPEFNNPIRTMLWKQFKKLKQKGLK